MKALFILHDAPYGTERSYNGLRLALELVKVDEVEVRMFLIGDAVAPVVSPTGFLSGASPACQSQHTRAPDQPDL